MIKRRALLTAAAATGLAAPGLLATGAAGATGPAGAAGRVRSGGIPWEQLRAAVRGAVVLPGDAGYERAKQLASAQFDTVRPQAVVRCESAHDVRGRCCSPRTTICPPPCAAAGTVSPAGRPARGW